MPKTKKKQSPPTYRVMLRMGGKSFTADGATVAEALAKLNPGRFRGNAILSVHTGDTSRERILGVQQTFRLFNGGRIMREVAIKNISLLFT